MDEIVKLEDESSSLVKITVYGILLVSVSIVAIIYLTGPGNLGPKITMTLIAIVLLGLFGNNLTAYFKKILVYPDYITTTTITGMDTILIEDINSIKIEFIEYVHGFTRMRLLGSLLQGDTMPTSFSYEINADKYVIYDTIKGIKPSEVEEFIGYIQESTGVEPQVEQIDEVDMRGTLFYFNLQGINQKLDLLS